MEAGALFFSFKGRINRSKFWVAVLVYAIIYLVLAPIGHSAGELLAFQLLSLIVNIVLAISGLAVGTKRLHDRNKTGWWLLLFYVVPTLLFSLIIVLTRMGPEPGGSGMVELVLYLIGLAIVIWMFVELGGLRGTIGPNQYGPDPIAPEVLTPPVRTH